MISRCPLEKDSEWSYLNIVSWKQRHKLISSYLVANTIHLATGHINSQELGELILADSLVHDSEQNSEEELQ